MSPTPSLNQSSRPRSAMQRRTFIPMWIAMGLLASGLSAQVSTLSAPQTAKSNTLQGVPKAIEIITEARLREHLKVVASDEFEGRLTGTPGQEKAAKYIASQFQAFGLEPLGDFLAESSQQRGWTQSYDITLRPLTENSGLSRLGPDSKPGHRMHKYGAWYLPTSIVRKSGEVKVEGQLRYVGAPKRGFEDDELEGCIAVAKLAVDTRSTEGMGTEAAMMRSMQDFTRMRNAAKEIAKSGAKAAVFIADEITPGFASIGGMFLTTRGHPGVLLGQGRKRSMSDMAAFMGPKIPVLILIGDDAKSIVDLMGLKPEEAFKGTGPRMTSEDSFRLIAGLERKPAKATNVVGLLRGSDPALSAEAIVYSSHMDHVGTGPAGEIFNGADDDGSGTVGLLALAEAYSKLAVSERPRRSIIFLSVSGEELGLWGSAHYADNSTWPVEKMIANINLDMIGRSTSKVPSNAIAVTPTFAHRKYSSLAKEASVLGKSFGLEMRDGDKFYSRSDHYNFAKKGIPVVFFCDDEHPDYHMPTDTWDRIEFKKIESVTRLSFVLGLRTANRDERPEVLGKQEDW